MGRCREELQASGVCIPVQADPLHACTRFCNFHHVAVIGDVFLCETSGKIHQCLLNEACEGCVSSDDDHFFVCPASGRCFQKPGVHETEEEENQDWEQEPMNLGGWFEQGYGMSEDQAGYFFDEHRR